jgi:CheY-like chemotaxis protein
LCTDAPRNSPIVLVVEDEPMLQELATAVLDDCGFSTLSAANASEAVAILQDRSDIQAVFTDVNMPGTMDGLSLAKLIHRCWPLIGVIVTSGRPVELEDLRRWGRFLPKPYAPAALVKALHEVVA